MFAARDKGLPVVCVGVAHQVTPFVFVDSFQDIHAVQRIAATAERACFDMIFMDAVKILPGVMPVVGRTDRKAFDTLAKLQGFVASSNALALLSDRLGVHRGATRWTARCRN